MSEIKIKKMILGVIDTNLYIVYDNEKKEAVIIDPADEPGRIMNAIKKLDVKPVAIFLTHGHYDHILAANFLKNYYHIPIVAHNREKTLLKNSNLNLSAENDCSTKVYPDIFVKDKEEVEVGGMTFKVFYTPGHTAGSCCYYMESEKIMFSGDTMFAGTCGRCDLPTGDPVRMAKSIEKLLKLSDEVVVFPGHGDQTVIGIERFYYQW
ncbi:Glyoxylase, beta-lactamase superfamily II [Eubacterium uniforme]|uniref:Glyoxylase, beta-lactamase superfamily II n=1 Tax=Eubacterium uniforme TaxID=39495 RepID=A0A1T4V498_9FIRM|nr:MBL fold metallo-hydrolase [Eubacterium uniforme]SKA59694.1 Glyoxylase, beta-lactamase superfamily II [Eubacterium uniforme]